MLDELTKPRAQRVVSAWGIGVGLDDYAFFHRALVVYSSTARAWIQSSCSGRIDAVRVYSRDPP
jgi:hypothetical protein